MNDSSYLIKFFPSLNRSKVFFFTSHLSNFLFVRKEIETSFDCFSNNYLMDRMRCKVENFAKV